MGKIKGKKGTPEHLDEVLRLRDVIDEETYTDFWRGFNRIREKNIGEREDYTDQWLANFHGELAEPPVEKPFKRERRIVRKSKGWATRDAKRIGGKVVRVDRFGKRNPRGRSWKAIGR